MIKRIIPAILAKSLPEFKSKALFFKQFFSLVQMDVMDSTMVDNRSFYDLAQIRSLKLGLDFELHLMVSDPMEILEQWLNYPRLKRVIIHLEAFKKKEGDLYGIIKLLKQRKIKVGLAINPETKITSLDHFSRTINFILVMGVHPGRSGQKLIPSTLNKIRETRKRFPKKEIAVDGGVTLGNYKKILQSGATTLDAASMLYSLLPDEVKDLKKSVKNA